MSQTLADRAWRAYHSLPRDSAGKPPTLKDLELSTDPPLGNATLSRLMRGEREEFHPDTFRRIVLVLNTSEAYLLGQPGARAPALSGMMPPRPGMPWRRHGDVPGWRQSVELALMEKPPVLPPAAFLAGADMPVFAPIELITPEIAIAAAMYAYAIADREDQRSYSTQTARETVRAGLASGKVRAAPLRRPAAK